MMKKKKLFNIFVLIVVFSFVFLPVVAQAGEGIVDPWAGEDSVPPGAAGDALDRLKTVGGGAYGTGEAEPKGPVEIVGEIIKIGLNIIGLVFLGLLLYGAYLWMTARGDEQRLTKAKNTLEAAVIGLIIIFAAYGITYFVVDKIVNQVITTS
jgi:hypothetical protein